MTEPEAPKLDVVVARFIVDGEAISEAVSQGAAPIDLVMFHVDKALNGIAAEGVDVFDYAVVTLGRHPDWPGAVTIEAKGYKPSKAE